MSTMIVDPLDIVNNIQFDNRISSIEVHTHNPYANSPLNNNDIIRIHIQQENLIILPCKSYLYVEGKIIMGEKAQDATADDLVNMDNNCVAFMFDEIRYEINGVEVDRTRNVGRTSTLKNCVSMTSGKAKVMSMAGWTIPDQMDDTIKDTFDFCVPLSHLMGFFEDYKQVVANVRHELILIRSDNDANALYGSKKIVSPKIELSKVQWKVPHISLNECAKHQFMQILQRDEPITLSFRSWDLYESSQLPQTDKHHTWCIRTSSHLKKPRYAIIAFFDGSRWGKHTSRNCQFISANVTDIKLYVNSTFFPYDKLDADFDKKKYSVVYQMYTQFIESYYGYESCSPLFNKIDFAAYGPFFVIDCSHQRNSIMSGDVDVTVEIECKAPVPANTRACCLILHDRIVEYKPLRKQKHKIGHVHSSSPRSKITKGSVRWL